MKRALENVPHLIWNGHDESTLRNDGLSDDLTIVSALKFALDTIERPISKTVVAGLTGAGFYIGWNAEHLLSGLGGAVFQYPHERGMRPSMSSCYFDLLFRYMGIHHEIIGKQSERVWHKVCSSIDKDVPAVAVEWDPVERRGHSAIICGYDSEEENFLARIFQHEKQDHLTPILPRDLQYTIVLKPDDTWKGKRTGATMREFALESLANAVELLVGGWFQDEERWQLGIGCYATQARLILEGMNPEDEGYFLKEHFLFWRLQILLLCRSYACEYLRYLRNQHVFDEAESLLDPLIVEYEHFKEFFNSKLTIHADLESIINGRPLSWNQDGNQIPMKQLCMSEAGRRELAAFLLYLGQIEERVLSLLTPIVRRN